MEARGYLVTYTPGMELDVTCYKVTYMIIIHGMVTEVRVCRWFIGKTTVLVLIGLYEFYIDHDLKTKWGIISMELI